MIRKPYNREKLTNRRFFNAAVVLLAVLCLIVPGDAGASIVTHPTDITVKEGHPASFSVTATGSDNTYQWQKNGTDIPGATSATHAVPAASLADHGALFRCVVITAQGVELSQAATLRVLPSGDLDGDGDIDRDDVNMINLYRNQPASACPDCDIDGDGTITVLDARKLLLQCDCPRCLCEDPMPEITSHPADTAVTAGESASFLVSATGDNLVYQWQRGTADIPGATQTTYTIIGTALSDNWSMFRCVVSNDTGSVISRAATLFVEEEVSDLPQISEHPSNQEVVEGGSATFSVTATGADLTYQWQKDNADILGATGSSYTISNCTLADHNTTYRCVVSNSAGSVTSQSATLTVQLASPVVTGDPISITVTEGDSAEFSVTATGSNLTYQWQQDEVDIPNATDSTYSIPAVPANADGTSYRCVVSNAAGSATSQPATLTVQLLPPVIDVQPIDVSVTEGQLAAFSVFATGSNLSYQWRRNGDNISGATNPTYSIAAATLTDDGSTYQCIVSNSGGSVTSNLATLYVVMAAPVITGDPVSITVTEGDPVEFSVTATGSNLTYQWQQDEVDIPNATASTYSIPAAQAGDDGTIYRCVVSNASGSATSQSATLTVSLLPPTIVNHPVAVAVTEGDPVSFIVVATGTNVTYQWQRNGSDIPGATDAAYSIAATTLADDGSTYQCIVSNSGGSVTSNPAALTVLLAVPVITEDPVSAIVTEGEPAEFFVTATGSNLAYQWKKNENDIPGANQSTYSIAAVTAADDGTSYRCVVSNAAGSVTSQSATLTVSLLPPAIVNHPAAVTVTEGGPASFSVVATGTNLNYQWQRDGSDIPGANDPTYSIAATTLADDGTVYQCIVSNTGGSVTSNPATLTVQLAVPVITGDPVSITVTEGEPAEYTVTATGSNLYYQWQKNESDIPGANQSTFSIAAVTAADDGTSYRCVVSNAAGSVTSSSAQMTVQLLPPVIDVQPIDVTVTEGQLAAFSVFATGSQLTYQWQRNGNDIPGATDPTYSIAETALTDDNTAYQCIVNNTGGSITSNSATLYVVMAAPVITEDPVSITVTEGDPAEFTVTATGSNLSYQWQKNDADIPGANLPTYGIAVITVADDGTTYGCVVQNAAGSQTSQSATLTVELLPPTIVNHPVTVTVFEGGPASFTVVATGTNLNYQWQRDGSDVSGATDPTYSIAETALTDDNTVYQCVVSNTGGSVTSNPATLTVQLAAPVITGDPESITVTEGESAEFSVTTTGSNLAYQWQRNENDIPGANQSTYSIAAVTAADDGTSYRCVVSNAAGSATSQSATLTVELLPPTIVNHPVAVTVTEGDPASFTVAATGTDLTYQWQRNGADILGATESTYSITAVTLTDDGSSYQCIVSNTSGSVTSNPATLTVLLAAPVIAGDPNSITVTEGEPAEFSVAATGSNLAYQWQKNESDIPGANQATYSIAAAIAADNGSTYRCVVSNAAGSVTSQSATLMVQLLPPTITDHPVAVTVTEGGAASFTVVAAGTDLTYQWQRNGADIPGATESTYSIAVTTLADDGASYQCIVSNSGGSVTGNPATLTVQLAAPVITEDPVSITVTESEPAEFSVTATGSNLEYQWQKNGNDIPGANQPTYGIAAITAADDGSAFRCVVQNAAGSVTSQSATLTVELLSPTITTHPVAVTVIEGGPASFTVVATGTNVSYQWQRDGNDIPGATDPTYSILATTLADDGSAYQCVVSNSGGSVTSNSAVLTVQLAAPVITGDPESITVTEGEPAEFSVTTTGSNLAYQWQKNENDIPGANQSTYSIAAVTAADDGTSYRCVVSNAAGSVTSVAALLTVQLLPPVIDVQPIDVTVTEGQLAAFSVFATGSNLTYQWQRNGSDISGATDATYSIAATTLADDGSSYQCVVSNTGGSVISNSAVLSVVMAAPVITGDPVRISVTEGEPAEFSVTATGSNLTYQWQKNESDIPGANQSTYSIAAATAADDGTSYRCVVSNAAGSVTSQSATLTVQLLPPVISVHPVDVTVMEDGPALFSVVATGSNLVYQWQKNGTDIAGAAEPAYSIAATSLADSGSTFRCVVSNTGGSVTSDAALLTVTELPVPAITDHPDSLTAIEGRPAEFSITATGPDLSYQWQKNNVDIPNATGMTYAIVESTLADNGNTYRCVVSNTYGSVTSQSATLTVEMAPPVITGDPANITVNEGEPAQFAVTVTGSNLAYQWQKNESDIPGATQSTYSIAAVAAADDGASYRCVVSNAAGSVTSQSASLTVQLLPPTITDHPVAVTVTEGDPASFTVAAAGTDLSYQWQRNGTDIPGATDATYSIAATTLADDGASYQCIVSNSGGSVTSNPATLTVQMAVPVITEDPVSATVTEGEPAEFSVTATGSNLAYQWQINENDIPGANQSTYSISAVAAADDGSTYRCVVSNAAGSVTSNAAQLTVQLLPPVIDVHPVDVTVTEGQLAAFSVFATGSNLTYQWQRNGTDISGATDATYSIAATTLADDGSSYQCIVSNTGGSLNSNSAVLSVVMAAPVITGDPVSITVTEGDPVEFSVTATGSNLTYQWQKDEVDISNATASTYSIPAVPASADGTSYRCVVSNAAGSATSQSATLTVQLLPPVIDVQPIDVTVTEGQLAAFSVVATGSNLSYQWQRNGSDISGATDATYSIAVTTLVDDGSSYQCVVSNSGGSVTSNPATLTVLLAAPVITVDPVSATVTEGEPAEFSVTATGSNTEYQWQKNESDITGANQSTYSIAAVTAADDGSAYRCVVSNAAGSVTSQSATLTVQLLPPTITDHPVAVTVTEGDPASFSVVAAGTDLTYQWQRNGSDISGASDATHSIAATTLADDGASYQCIVSNSGGSVTSNPATLTVNMLPPVIQTHPSDISINVGETATFSIVATGSNLSYQWQRRTTSMDGANQTTFTMTDAAYSDNDATFRCIVSNSAGSVTSTAAALTVVDNLPPDLTVDGPDDRTTSDEFAQITGVAIDSGSGVSAVEVNSDRYPGQVFGAIVNSIGSFSAGVPLHVGVNQLTIVARDVVGNETQKIVTVTLEISELPTITITAPVDGATVFEDRITVSGVVRSTLPPDQIRVVLGSLVQFPSGSGGEYSFTFEDVRLAQGANTLTVTAETIYGNSTDTVRVTYLLSSTTDEPPPPVIEIYSSSQPTAFITEDPFVVSGTASSDAGIQSVTVNGQPATLIGSGTQVSFEFQLALPAAGEDELQIVVVATDTNGMTSSVSYIVRYDVTPPHIQLTSPGLLLAPEVNLVTETPYPIAGTVTEKNLAGVSMNDQDMGVLPSGSSDVWSFGVGVELARGEERTIAIKAWDMAGNRTSQEVILRLETSVDIEIISPAEDAELMATAQTVNVEVLVRASGMADTDQVSARIEQSAPTILDRAGNSARGILTVAAADGMHRLYVEVVNDTGDIIAASSRGFSIISADDIPLTLERQEPANNAKGVEPNAFVAFYFNKPIDPTLLQVEVLETAHGKIYETLEKGAGLTQLSDIKLIDVHREREPVPGGLSHFPENTMAAFYPERDFAYDGLVYVTVIYDGDEVSRSSFRIRPLPTFIQGFVVDQFMVQLAGINVELPALERATVTDKEGNFGFGFGDPAERAIPGGRYQIIFNPGLKNRAFGSVAAWVNVETGRLNTVGTKMLPIINPEVPFIRIYSGQEQALLARNELMLNLKNASLLFPDGRNQGDVHIQYMDVNQVTYALLPSAIPHWLYVAQPMGIEVAGSVEMTISMPTLYGSYDYISQIGERLVLLGLDPNSLQMIPVGVGKVDVDNRNVVSEGAVMLQRLDILGYAMIPQEKQSILERYAKGEINLKQMIGELEFR